MWFARSPEVIHSPFMENMVWLRVPGDIVFALGTLFLALFVLRVMRRPARPATVPVEVPIEIAGRPAARARVSTKA
jgi:nitric oxide reductase subunit B